MYAPFQAAFLWFAYFQIQDLIKEMIETMYEAPGIGLCIAVPSLFAYHLFKNRTNLFAVMLEEEVTEFISTFLMEAEADHAH